ncbi:MAG: mechanosensitive ion channel family protein [Bacillota bacterium]
MIERFLNQSYFGNSVSDYLISLAILFLGIILVTIIKKIVLSRFRLYAAKTESRIDDIIILQISRFIIPLLYLAVLFFTLNFLKIPSGSRKNIDSAGVAIFTFFAIRFLIFVINSSVRYFSKSKGTADSANQSGLKGISTFISIFVWGLGVVFLLDNLGFKVSAVVAGLGIGGIAVALAAQAVLGDFFSYFVIFFDRPFQIGDFISVDDKAGTVIKIGIKTTRVTSVSGEEIVFPNSNLTNSRLHNHSRLQRRRVQFKISVAHQTKPDVLSQIPQQLKAIVEKNDLASFDRAHFQSYSDSGIVFEIVYFINSPDYKIYMDIQQNINLDIYREFEKGNIKMAYYPSILNVGN